MEVDPDVSDVDQLSEVNVTGDEVVQGQINAYGSPIGANSRELRCESGIVTASGLAGTSQNINRVVRISRSQAYVNVKIFKFFSFDRSKYLSESITHSYLFVGLQL